MAEAAAGSMAAELAGGAAERFTPADLVFHSGGFGRGGGAFHYGGIRPGGVFRGSGFRAGPAFHTRGVGFHRHHFHRRAFYGAAFYPYYDYAYYRPYRRC